VAPQERSKRTAAEIALAEDALVVTPEMPVEDLLRRPAFARVGRAVVADAGAHVVGLVSVTDVQRRVRARQLARCA
jgi:CBS domain containing-hemolysin-like protein